MTLRYHAVGIPVVFHVVVADIILLSLVPVSDCVRFSTIVLVALRILLMAVMFPFDIVRLPVATVIPAFAVYNQDDVIVPVANVDADRFVHDESAGFSSAQNQGNDEDLKYQSRSV